MVSLRRTLLIRTLALLTVVSVIATVASWLSVKLEVNGFLDNQMRDIALSAGQGNLGDDVQPQFWIEDEDELSVQIFNLKDERINRTGPTVDVPLASAVGFSDVTVGSDGWRRYRAQDAQRIVQVSQRWSAREEVANKAAFGAAIPLLISLPIAWLVLGWSVSQVLRGVTRLSSEIGGRDVNATEPIDILQTPTEMHGVLHAMNELLERQQQALDQQKRFVTDAAHELRTPLAALQLQVDNMSKFELTDSLQEIRSHLAGGSRRASALVGQLLKLARAEASATSLPESIDLTLIVKSVLARFSIIAENRNIELHYRADGAATASVVEADLDSILSNLIDNAIRYSGPGSKAGIYISLSKDTVSIKVIDTGPGIPEEKLPQIYDRFFRAASQEIEGSGLGLSIARALCERNGLELRIMNSQDGTGIMAVIDGLRLEPQDQSLREKDLEHA